MTRFLALAIAALLSTPAQAAHPVSLAPPVNAQMLYGPDGPRPLPAEHPLHGRVIVDPIAGAPEKIGGFLLPIAKAKELNEQLGVALSRTGMLAAKAEQAAFRLVPTWGSIDAPQKVGISSEASVRIHYELRRIDTGQPIFAREIATSTRSTGGVGSDRLKGVARLAIQMNYASALACLDKAAYGNAPEDCALNPELSYRAPRPVAPVFIPR